MIISSTLFTSTALSLSLLATTATADLTPAQVWGDWTSYLEGMGYTVTATQAPAGNTLAVNDIVVQIINSPDMEQITIRMGALQFVGNSDGTVDVVMPDVMPMAIEVIPTGPDDPVKVDVTYTQSGQKMTVSGDPDAMAYDYAADSFALAMISLLVDGTVMDSRSTRFSLGGTAIQSKTTVTVGKTRSYAQTLQIGALGYDLYFKDPEDVEAISIASTIQSLGFTGTSAVPTDPAVQRQGIIPMIAAGLTVDGTFTLQGTETKTAIVSAEGETKIKTGSANATLGVTMGADGVRYDAAAEKVQIGGQLAGLPFPLFAEMENAGFALLRPVLKSSEPQSFASSFQINGLVLSEIFWALLDPGVQLPRDPINATGKFSGLATPRPDTPELDVLPQWSKESLSLSQISALKIETFKVDAVGAQLDVISDLTFDHTAMINLPGLALLPDLPSPTGTIAIDVAGANTLLERLVATGRLRPDQSVLARLALGFLAVPGSAPDTLTSKIEFSEDGQILANGQRIR